jgi:hypothetical protein
VSTVLTEDDFGHIVYLARCTLARKPGKNNWLEEDAVDGLPDYICRIARAVNRDGGKSISQAIAIAVGRVKTWASGGGGVTAKTRAQAAKALAEWEKKKVAAKANNKKMVKTSHDEEITLFFANSYNVDDVRRQYRENYPASNTTGPYRWIREMWSDHLIVNVEDGTGESTKYVKVPYSVDKDGTATFGSEVEVKQAYVALSVPELQTDLTDAQLERATLIPCSQKDRGALSKMVRLSSERRDKDVELIQFSADKPNLKALLSRVE